MENRPPIRPVVAQKVRWNINRKTVIMNADCTGKPVIDNRDVFQHGCYELIHAALTTNKKYIAAGTAISLVLLVRVLNNI
jgi:hypothetical protein